MGYLKNTISGVSWVGALRGSNRVMVFVKLAVLARILTPGQFGIFAIATLVLAFLEVVSETGINIFLIAEKRKLEGYINTAWVISIIRGIFIFLTILVLSGPIALYFSTPESRHIIILISLVPLIRGFVNPSLVRFQKELAFSKEFLFRFFIYLVDATVSILVAIYTKSTASLAVGMIAASIFEVVASFVFLTPIPKLFFERKKAIKIFNRGKWISMAGILNYAFEHVDDTVVGKLLGTTSLGIYQMAYKISSLPLTEVTDVVKKVTFPVFVKIKNDRKRLKSAYIKSLLVISAVVIPLGVVLYTYPHIFIKILLGSAWVSAADVLKILSVFGVIRAIVVSTWPLFLAVNKQEYITIITLVGLIVAGVLIIPATINYGVAGAAGSVTAGVLATVPVAYIFFRKITDEK